MVHMKSRSSITKFLNSNTFKNSVIVFGMCLSLFTITSFDGISESRKSNSKIVAQESDNSDQQELLRPDQSDSKQVQKQKASHNFIASYLLQESSTKREDKKSNSEGKIINHLFHLQKIIISKTFGAL